MTTDADLAINTHRLADVPEIGTALRQAGFTADANPGHWVSVGDIAVDLMVVPHQAGTTRDTARAARLAPHDKRTARIARGLEPALIDHDVVTLAALDTTDARAFELRVAGPAALLTAKVIKIGERLDQSDRQPDRLKEKDSLDVFRLLQAVPTEDLVRGCRGHLADEHAAKVTAEALTLLRTEGATPQGILPILATRAALGDPTVAPAFAGLVVELLEALNTPPSSRLDEPRPGGSGPEGR